MPKKAGLSRLQRAVYLYTGCAVSHQLSELSTVSTHCGPEVQVCMHSQAVLSHKRLDMTTPRVLAVFLGYREVVNQVVVEPFGEDPLRPDLREASEWRRCLSSSTGSFSTRQAPSMVAVVGDQWRPRRRCECLGQ